MSFRESILENGMLPYLGKFFHDLGPEKLGSWTWGMVVFMAWVLKNRLGYIVFVTVVTKSVPVNGVLSGTKSCIKFDLSCQRQMLELLVPIFGPSMVISFNGKL